MLLCLLDLFKRINKHIFYTFWGFYLIAFLSCKGIFASEVNLLTKR